MSPYRPGFGERPAVLVGRDRQLARADAILARVNATRRQAPAAMVLVGSRGLGKTVTLDLIGERARAQGFMTAAVGFDRQSNNAQRLAASVAEAVAPLHRGGRLWDQLKQRLAGLEVEVNAGVVRMSGRLPDATQDAGVAQRDLLTSVLVDASRLAADRQQTGLAIQIDELQEGSRADLGVVANALQDSLRGHEVPFAVFAAGLPDTPGSVMAAASFTERFDFRILKPLTRDESTVALVRPAQDLQVRWDGPCLDQVLDAAGGSPYLLQRMGDEIWEVARPSAGDTITSAAVTQGLDDVTESLSVGMFPGRFDKATRVEQDVMTAMAQVTDDEGVARIYDIALVTGRASTSLSPVRRQLLDKGLVEAPARGTLRFTMPGFDAFVRDKTDTPHLGRQELSALEAARRQERTQRAAGTVLAARVAAAEQPPHLEPPRRTRDDDHRRPPEHGGPTQR